MLLKPKQTKYRKYHKGRISYNIRSNQNWKTDYEYGLVALEPNRVTASNIYAIELALKRKLKGDVTADGKKSSFEIRLFPHIPVTKKPIETRMGKGKGNIDYWMTRVKAGAVLVEFSCSNETFGKLIGKVVSSKLPMKTKFISRK